MRLLLLLFALSAVTACSSTPDDPIDMPPPPPPPPPDTAKFTADPALSPSLRVEGVFSETELVVQIYAGELGSVFGIAGRLEFDPAHLAVANVESAEPLGEAHSLLRTDDGAIVFGFAKNGPAAGEAMLDGAVKIATVRLKSKKAGDSRLELSRVMIRRRDSSFVPAAFLGADVHTVGGQP